MRSQFLESPRLLDPIEWEATQKSAVVVIATYLEEFPLEDLVQMLKQGEENSPCHPVEAHPKVFYPDSWPQRSRGRRLQRGYARNGCKGCQKPLRRPNCSDAVVQGPRLSQSGEPAQIP